jgi:hypothetical protein
VFEVAAAGGGVAVGEEAGVFGQQGLLTQPVAGLVAGGHDAGVQVDHWADGDGGAGEQLDRGGVAERAGAFDVDGLVVA